MCHELTVMRGSGNEFGMIHSSKLRISYSGYDAP